MRKIFYFYNGCMAVAWIGSNAPIPEGWHLDENKAKAGDDHIDEKPFTAKDVIANLTSDDGVTLSLLQSPIEQESHNKQIVDGDQIGDPVTDIPKKTRGRHRKL